MPVDFKMQPLFFPFPSNNMQGKCLTDWSHLKCVYQEISSVTARSSTSVCISAWVILKRLPQCSVDHFILHHLCWSRHFFTCFLCKMWVSDGVGADFQRWKLTALAGAAAISTRSYFTCHIDRKNEKGTIHVLCVSPCMCLSLCLSALCTTLLTCSRMSALCTITHAIPSINY